MPDNVVITINGAKQADAEADLVEVVVDTNLYLPAMFSITVQDHLDPATGKLQYTDSDTFKAGSEVKIEVETDSIPEEAMAIKATLIIGEITAVEPVFRGDGMPYLTVQGYDRSHHLTRGKKTRTYGDANPQGQGIKEDQIINTIVQETAAITGKSIDTSGFSAVKYPYVIQYNQTDLEFLWTRARRLGYQVYVEDKMLYFQKADAHRGAASDKPAALRWPLTLESFTPRLTVMRQVDKAVVKGWDPATKQPIEGTSSTDSSKTIPAIGLGKKGSALAKEALGGTADETTVDRPVLTVDEAKAMAAARFAEAEGQFIRADGACRQGDPRLIAGRQVTIEGVGERFGGDYYVTEARHTWSAGKYHVTFSVTGRTPNTVSYLLGGNEGHDKDRIFGVVTAKVVNLEDPENLGRVQVMFPWLPKYKDADLASNWARIAAPMAGIERGFLFLPEVDDEVLVAFEHGDLNHPYVVGTLWNAKDKPPAGTKDSVLAGDKKKVDQRVIRSRSGHLIVLDDTEGEEQIVVQDKTTKNSIVISSKENTLTVTLEGDLVITTKGAASITADKAITIETKDAITLKSTKDVSIDCQNFNVKAKSNAKVEATANVELKGTAGAKLEGAQVGIQGQAMVEIKGGLIKLN
ncbi:MAG: VgrG-related protein [Anaerolineae bacterium]|nr:VgrG-related protein [Anaerolineae bacterium]